MEEYGGTVHFHQACLGSISVVGDIPRGKGGKVVMVTAGSASIMGTGGGGGGVGGIIVIVGAKRKTQLGKG